MWQGVTRRRIQKVFDHLDKHGPLRVENVYEAARQIGIGSQDLTRVLSIVRSPEWIADNGWTIPFVPKGIGVKAYSVQHTVGQTDLLRDGNQIKASEMETHMRRNLAGLQLEAKLAKGKEKRVAQILATTTKAALDLIDLGP